MDPLTQAIQLLRPQALTWKEAECRGDWGLRFPANPGVAFCVVAAGGCWLRLQAHDPLRLEEGDFAMLAAPPAWSLGEGDAPRTVDGRIGHLGLDRLKARVGAREGEPTARIVGGHFAFDDANSDLLAGLLPPVLHIRAADPGAARLRGLLDLIGDEAFGDRPGRALILERLLEVMLVEAIRLGGQDAAAVPRRGLLAGLADPQVAAALGALHADVRRAWTVGDLAAVANASRSAFAARFTRIVGVAPIDYLLGWRMALAKDALRRGDGPMSEVAFACGYQSAAAFSTAFRRVVGCSPARYERERRAAA